jgi:nucleoside phosphorylase
MQEHLGIEPAAEPPREGLAAERAEPSESRINPSVFAEGLIDFDSQGSEGAVLRAANPKGPPSLRHFVQIEWPAGLTPTPAAAMPTGKSLPEADVLIVTWTADEGSALSRVMTPGHESHRPVSADAFEPGTSYWEPYDKNFATITSTMRAGAPAIKAGRLGTYWTTKIGDRSVTLFKSDSHMSQDSARNVPRDPATTPNRLVWEQIIDDVKPKWVITTGTGGGIGSGSVVGDVIVSRFVTFDSLDRHAIPPVDTPTFEDFSCPVDAPRRDPAETRALFSPNAGFLPGGPSAPLPQIHFAATAEAGVLTTAGFDYDDSKNTDGLQGHGLVCDMGDAVLGSVCKQLGNKAPNYLAIRNVSDPQIDAADGTPKQQQAQAGLIYRHYGKWSSVCSGIVCWSVVAAL